MPLLFSEGAKMPLAGADPHVPKAESSRRFMGVGDALRLLVVDPFRVQVLHRSAWKGIASEWGSA